MPIERDHPVSPAQRRAWISSNLPPPPASENAGLTLTQILDRQAEENAKRILRVVARYRLAVHAPTPSHDGVAADLYLAARNALKEEGIMVGNLDTIIKLGEYRDRDDRPEEQMAIMRVETVTTSAPPAIESVRISDRSEVAMKSGDELDNT